MNKDQKIEKNETKEEISEKIKVIKEAHEQVEKLGAEIKLSNEEIDREILSIIDEIPRDDLQDEEKRRVAEYREATKDNSKILEWVKKDKELIMLSYMDGRDYLKLPNRAFVRYKIEKRLDKIMDKENVGIEDMHKIARFDFDMNGLKALNDLGGHASGDEGLRLFSEVIKSGKTIQWLKEMGMETMASIEGGDEFGLVVYGDVDLRPMLKEIEQRILDEVNSLEVDHLINFENTDIKTKLEKLHLKIPEGFKFKIGSSVGSATFGEALNKTDLSDLTKYKDMVRRITGNQIGLSDNRSREQKEMAKARRKEAEPILHTLYTRLNEEVAELNYKLEQMKETVEKQKFQLDKTHDELVKCETKLAESYIDKMALEAE